MNLTFKIGAYWGLAMLKPITAFQERLIMDEKYWVSAAVLTACVTF